MDLYKVKVVKNILVSMRDGTRLAVDLIMPEAEGERFPALIEVYPYRKDDYTSMADPAIRRSNSYLAERGYVIVRGDVRGTGGSEGASTDMYEPEEMTDGYDLVEWAAKQQWCTGAVGMMGSSYGGVNSMQIAMHQPPSLKAIVPMLCPDEVYGDTFYPGGALRALFELGNYGPRMIATTFSPPDPDYSGSDWAKIWEFRINSNEPWILKWLEHQKDGRYWRAKSLNPDFARIRCPTFLIMGWNDRYCASAFRIFSNLTVPKRLLMGPWQHDYMDSGFPGPRIDYLREIVRWFDRWLKGRETGVTEEPPITLFVVNYMSPSPRQDELSGFWRCEGEWPPKRVKKTAMYLEDGGKLAMDPQVKEGRDDFEYNAMVGLSAGFMGGFLGAGYGLPLDQRADEAYSLRFTSDELTNDWEMLGPVEATLYFSSTAEITNVVVKVCDVAENGSSLLVTRGILNVTHRESPSNPKLLGPNEVTELRILTDPMAHIFPAGHRIRLDVSGSDFPNVWPAPTPCTNSIHRGPDHHSRIIVPVAPAQDPVLPNPTLVPSTIVPSSTTLLGERPDYHVDFDIPGEIVSVRMSSGHGMAVNERTHYSVSNRFSMTVSLRDPSHSSVEGHTKVTIRKPESTIETDGFCVTTSNKDAFDVTAKVQIKVDGNVTFTKSWIRSFQREFL